MAARLTISRTHTPVHGNSPIDGIRILAALPAEWHKNLSHDSGDIVITIRMGRDLEMKEILDRLTPVLSDPAHRHLRLVACDTEPSETPDSQGFPHAHEPARR